MEAVILLFLSLVGSSSVVEKVKSLTGIEGGNITLPDPVLEFGFLLLNSSNIAMINQEEIMILDNKLSGRILWNRTTGLFTLTRLQRNDSGEYVVDSKGRNFFTSYYKLKVYETIRLHAVRGPSVSADTCTLLCSVDTAEETTLSWSKDNEVLNKTSSASVLPVTVHQEDFSSAYTCVAANPADEKALSVNVQTLCSEHNNTANTDMSNRNHYIIATTLTLTVLLAVFILWRIHDKNKRIIRQRQGSVNTDIHYADIQIREERQLQEEGLPDSSAAVHHPPLVSVYDKLAVHRMVPVPKDNV